MFLVRIPSDPKSVLFWGLSPLRLILLLIFLVLILILGRCINNPKLLLLDERLRKSKASLIITRYIFITLSFSFVFIIFFPPERIPQLSDIITRLRPFIIWINVVFVQYSGYLVYQGKDYSIQHIKEKLIENKKIFLLLLFFPIISIFILGIINQSAFTFTGQKLAFPPGAPLSSFQIFIFGIILVLFLLLETKLPNNLSSNKTFLALFFLIGAIAIITWNLTALSCGDDRPGPYPPNNTCYPEINDAVFSIGSHYITLGEGINNRWPTDKPLYLLFLSFAQVIAGDQIDDYLGIQIIIYAIVPIILVSFGKKIYPLSTGILTSGLFILVGSSAIFLYRKIGTLNVKIESSEILTTVLLVLLLPPMIKWLTDSENKVWAVICGGILGLASLSRINPFFIAPIIVYVIAWQNRSKWKNGLIHIALFSLAFSCVVVPWSLSAKDTEGNNFLLLKIQNVIESRFSPLIDKSKVEDTSSFHEDITSTQTINLQNSNKEIIEVSQETQKADRNSLISIVYHFINNEITVLAKLPTQMAFYTVRKVTDGPIWKGSPGLPLWRYSLTIENIILLIINFQLISFGVIISYKRFKLAGLSGIIIQVGYFLGNAIAQTSGGRYIEPVSWISLFYYCIGLTALAVYFLKLIGLVSHDIRLIPALSNSQHQKKRENYIVWGYLGLFCLAGFLLPMFNYLHPTLFPERDKSIENIAYTHISNYQVIPDALWNSLLNNPNVVIAQGRAFHTIYHRNPEFNPTIRSIEQLILADDHVYSSYVEGIRPKKHFTDNSKVIFVGCKIHSDKAWGLDRVKVNALAVVQLDNEQQIYIRDINDWKCE